MEILPDDVRDELRGFIINIKAVTSIQGASIKRADGEVIVSDQKAAGWYIPDESRGYIRLCTDLEETDEPEAVCTILHEFAHAHEHLRDNWRAESRWPERSELAACAQVVAWAARDYSNPYAGGYESASSVAGLAILMASEEWKRWRKRDLRKNSTDKAEHLSGADDTSPDVPSQQISALGELFLRTIAEGLKQGLGEQHD